MLDAEIRLVGLLEAKRAREKRRISIAEVARKTNMSRQHATKWFKNQIKHPSLQSIAALCRYFECTPNDFIIVRNEIAQ